MRVTERIYTSAHTLLIQSRSHDKREGEKAIIAMGQERGVTWTLSKTNTKGMALPGDNSHCHGFFRAHRFYARSIV